MTNRVGAYVRACVRAFRRSRLQSQDNLSETGVRKKKQSNKWLSALAAAADVSCFLRFRNNNAVVIAISRAAGHPNELLLYGKTQLLGSTLIVIWPVSDTIIFFFFLPNHSIVTGAQ